MLAHSPPLPLIIDYRNEGREVTAQDEEGILLALRRRRRVRRIRLCIPSLSLRRLVAAICHGSVRSGSGVHFPKPEPGPLVQFGIISKPEPEPT